MGSWDWSGGDERVVVAGAGGFIGARITRCLLEAGGEVHALVRSGRSADRLEGVGCHRLEVDVLDPDQMRAQLVRIRPTAVINAVRAPRQAGPEDWSGLLAGNVTAATHLLVAAHRSGCRRFVQIGSSTEYGPAPGPIGPDRPLQPVTPHGSTKAAASLICRSLAGQLGIRLAVLRPFQVYGPGDWPQHLIPQAIRASLEGRELRLSPGGRRDWVFVDDVADACRRALAWDGEHLVVNVGSGRQWTNAEVAERVSLATGRPVRVLVSASAARDWDRSDWVANIGRARELLGWEPRHDLDAGLAKTVAWERRRQAPREVAAL